MNKKELVSVIMNCYNGERYLKKSIQSLVSQSYKNWELIFWDNCSSDRSKKILCSFSDQRIKYYKNNNHTSLYKARNDAIKKSSGKYIAFLDTDDWWRNNKLKKQITFFLNNKNSHIVYSNLHTYFQVNKKLKIYHKDLLPSGFIFNQLSKNYFMPILTLIIKKKYLKNLNSILSIVLLVTLI